MKIRFKKAMSKGFSLVELLVVVAILGVLAGIATLAVSGSTTEAATAKCQADAKSLNTAVALYKADNEGNNPADSTALEEYFNGDVPAFSATHNAANQIVGTLATSFECKTTTQG